MVRILLLLFFFFGAVIGYTQENFVAGVITQMDGKVLVGKIDYREWTVNPRKIRFQTQDGHLYTFGCADIREFIIQEKGEVYQRAEVRMKDEEPPRFYRVEDIDPVLKLRRDTVFLLTLVRGKLNLFFLTDEKNRPHYFIQKDLGNLEELIRREVIIARSQVNGSNLENIPGAVIEESLIIEEYKKQLETAVSDAFCGDLHVRNLHYSHALMDFVKKYNDCVGLSTYVKPRDRGKVAFFIQGGPSWSFFTHKDLFHPVRTHLGTSFFPALGFGFDFGIPRTRDKLSLSLETNYHQSGFRGPYQPLSGPPGNRNVAYQVDLGGARFNSLLKYAFFTGKIQPYLKGGIGLAAYFNHQYTRVEALEQTTEVVTLTSEPLLASEVYAVGAAGLHTGRFFAEIRYETGNDLHRFTGSDLKMTRLSLQAGYSWFLRGGKH